jgi:bleomycin hydrolase
MASRFIIRARIWVGALALLAASQAAAAPVAVPKQKPSLDGKRLADKILSASDAERVRLMKQNPQAIELALRRHGLRRAALRADFMKDHNDHYSNELPPSPIRKQGMSGRCYIFTALNVIEADYHQRTNATAKLSRSYVNARDLQYTAYEALQTGAKLSSLSEALQPSVGEGGDFGRALQLLDKYGAVPEHLMRDTYDATHSAVAIKLLERTLVNAREKLKGLPRNSDAETAIIKQAQTDIDHIIARAFTGKDKLPEKFTVDGKQYTPQSYAAEQLGVKGADYVTLQDERSQRAGWNMSGTGVNRMETYNTRSVEAMKDAVRAAIDQGKKVYISAPVNNAGAPFMQPHETVEFERDTKGIMSIAAWDYGSLGLPEEKIDRGLAEESRIHPQVHAMTVTGYDLDPKTGKVIKWKVENSWGKEAGDEGIQHMYDDYFTTFVGNATVPRSALAAAMRKQIEDEYATWNGFAWEPK